MASIFTRALDTLTPWNRGGEVQRRQEKKKKDDQAQVQSPTVRTVAPKISLQPANLTPKPQQPTNQFENLNKNLVLNKPVVAAVPVVANQDVAPVASPKPGTVVKPTVARPKQSFLNKVRDQFDANTDADKFRRQDKTPTQDTVQANAAIAARSAGSIASNVTGGLLGAVKGVVQLPSAVLSAPKLVRLGAAKVTGNKEAAANIDKDKGVLSELARKYEDLVKPVTNKLTGAEEATDRAATALAPWAPNYVKPSAKVLSNLIPVDAAVSGITNLARARNVSRVAKEGEAAAGATTAAGETSRIITDEATKLLAEAEDAGVRIPVGQNIPVSDADVPGVPISVRNTTPQGAPIRELGGDTPGQVRIPTADEAAAQRAASRFESQDFPRPDDRIEGVTPRNPTEVVTARDLQAARETLDDSLRTGKIGPEDHAELADQLSKIKAVDEAPQGNRITVKMPDTIPVRNEIDVPTNLPEIPGTVRTTTQDTPMQAQTEAVANAPVVSSPAQLPREVQEVLDNPKQFNKRQVAAARNQRKLARQMAKTQEDTAEAMGRIETASPAAQSGEGFVQTGEVGKSANGGAYQKTNRAAEMQQAVQETANMSPGDVIQTARANQAETGGFNRRDIRNVAALFETKRIPRGTPEWQEARQILKEDGTVWGQTGALRNYTMRRTASADELMSRYESKIYRLADDPTKIDSRLFDDVEAAETAYASTRDEAMAAYNRFTENPTSGNAKLYHAAQDAAEKADKNAKLVEYNVAKQTLKGNKDVKQARVLEKMAQDADMYQMDAVDASMLSGTGTFVRNFVNSAVGGAEEGLMGGVASRIAGKLTGQKLGGGFGKGTVRGLKEGAGNIVDASKARATNAGKNPLEHVKNWATTGNQIGDTVIDSQTTHHVLDHYTQLLKDQGFKGRELTDRASVMARQDPDDLGRVYSNAARTAAGLGAGVTRNNKIETIVKNMISDAISGGKPGRVSEATAKLVTRMTLGFPTAIGRSTAEGVKRFTLGAPTFIKAMRTSDPLQRAVLIKEGIKQAGTGAAVIPPMFYAMGAHDLITGAYPSDPEERARWQREGITENSIKIGDAYYQLPSYLGAWALPGLFYASLGRNGGDFGAAAADTAKTIPALLPTDQASNILDVVNGRTDIGKFMAQMGAGAVRAATPGGALLNQLAKSFDPTTNDTNSGTNIENFVDKVLSGIPGVNNVSGIPDKVDDAGNPIHNPNAGELLLGAASARQGAGEERTGDLAAKVDGDLKAMTDIGVLDDPNLKAILNDKDLQIYNKFKSGEKLGEGDLKKLQEAFTKGISQTGDDSAYLEREQYDTNLSALQLKRQLMNADKTVKPSDLKKVDTAIKRGEIYRDGQIPYDMIEAYQSTGIDDWRKMGDPEDDNYDPDMYQKLWDIDQKMTAAGVSYKKGALDKNKYAAKKAGTGKGGSKKSDFSNDFGTLKPGISAPKVQEYDTIDVKSGGVPRIQRVRPNIVHNISSS